MSRKKKPVKAASKKPADRQPSIKKIASMVEQLMTDNDQSQAWVARKLGIRDRTLSAWLTGKMVCRHRMMLALALEALQTRHPGVSMDALLYDYND